MLRRPITFFSVINCDFVISVFVFVQYINAFKRTNHIYVIRRPNSYFLSAILYFTNELLGSGTKKVERLNDT